METTRATLLIRIRDRKDAGAWSEFDAIYRPMLGRFARARGLDSNEADDVVQHVMLAINAHIGGFQYDPHKGRFKGWLRTIVNNRIRNLLSRRGEVDAKTQDFARADSSVESPDEAFDELWMKEHLDFCLRKLRDSVDPQSYAAFEAYVLRDEPVEKVCAAMGLNSNQLYSIKFRLTKRLRELMDELLGADE